MSAKSVLCIVVINHVNWQRDNLRLGRENTGNLKYNLSGDSNIFYRKISYKDRFGW